MLLLSAFTAWLGRWRSAFCGLFSFLGRLFGRSVGDSAQARQARLASGRARRLNEHGYPRATEEQNYSIVKAFVEAVNEKAVCALASRINHGIPCRVVRRARGSFNYCLFLEFDRKRTRRGEATRWVVRLPIGHTVDRAWDKVVSEVMTIRYVQQHTTIPVPRVHAFGREASLVRRAPEGKEPSKKEAKMRRADRSRRGEGQVYIITDFVVGATLDTRLLTTADPALRQGFYLQLVDVLSQLRQLEFPRIGSLVPAPPDAADLTAAADGEDAADAADAADATDATDATCATGAKDAKDATDATDPTDATDATDAADAVLGPMLSMFDNVLCLPPPPMWTSTAQYLDHAWDVLAELLAEPVGSTSAEAVREELVALDGLRRVFGDVARAGPRGAPFVLHHCDLRSPNIIVDDQLRIQAIIDWEFTAAIPRALFMPPPWITGYHDSEPTSPVVHAEFRAALHLRAQHDRASRTLEAEWYGRGAAVAPDAPLSPGAVQRFCVARILQKPPEAVDLFYRFLAGHHVDGASPPSDADRDARIARYMADHADVVAAVEPDVQRRCEQSRRYHKYLDDNGIYERLDDRPSKGAKKKSSRRAKLKKDK